MDETASYPVVVYSKKTCKYCRFTKELLDQEGIEYHEHTLHHIPDSLVYLTKRNTVPQIFICGNFVGGFTDLSRAQSENRLRTLLNECVEIVEKAKA